MAKKPRANSQNKTIRNVVIAFSAIVIVIGALLIWNNRALSYAGTIDGERVPMAHLNFFHSNWLGMLGNEWGMHIDSATNDLARQWGWDDASTLWIISNQADLLGIVMTDDDWADVDEIVDEITAIFGTAGLRDWGFTTASFRRFAERMVLQDLVSERILQDAFIDEDVLQEQLDEFLEESALELQTVSILYVEVETREEADRIMGEVFMGRPLYQLMREYSIAYDVYALPLDDEGYAIEIIDARATPLASWQVTPVQALGVGTLSDIHELENGNFAIFQIVDIEDPDFEAVEEFFRSQFIENAQNEHRDNALFIWRENARIEPNSRILN